MNTRPEFTGKHASSTILIDLGPDYGGRMFSGPFYVSEDYGVNPGWFVFGRNPEYNGRLRKVVAYLDVPLRTYKHWNGPRQHGWRLKREAQVVADMLNNMNNPITKQDLENLVAEYNNQYGRFSRFVLELRDEA